MKKTLRIILIIGILVLTLVGCSKEPTKVVQGNTANVEENVPANDDELEYVVGEKVDLTEEVKQKVVEASTKYDKFESVKPESDSIESRHIGVTVFLKQNISQKEANEQLKEYAHEVAEIFNYSKVLLVSFPVTPEVLEKKEKISQIEFWPEYGFTYWLHE